MTSPTRGTTRTSEPESLGAMVSGVTADLSLLVKDQIALAKSELRESARSAASGSAMFVAAGVLAFLAFVFLLVTAAYGLVAAGLPTWAGFGIVTLVLVVVAVVLVLVGRRQLQGVRGPERTQQQLAELPTLLPGHTSGAGPSS